MKLTPLAHAFIILLIALTSSTAFAEPPSSGSAGADEMRGIYYGEGLRHLAEGRYDEAVTALFRLYGLERSAPIMELIIETYDAMGHCDAAARQLDFFERHHSGEGEPALDRCQNPGEIVLQCDDFDRSIRVGPHRRASCGELIRVPADETHRIAAITGGEVQEISVAEGERASLEIDTTRPPPAVALLPPRQPSRVARLPGFKSNVPRLPFTSEDRPRVPLLPTPSTIYRVYETSDGLYHLWVADDGSPAGDREGPQVEMICPADADAEGQCEIIPPR